MPQDVTLGKHTYTVEEQPIGWLENQLGDKLELLANVDLEKGNLIGQLGSQAYTVLKIFLPELMPEWEWRGYASREAFEKGEYDRAADNSPGAGEIKRALAAAISENGDLGATVGNVLGPELIRALLRQAISTQLFGKQPSLPQPNGASDPTSSGTDGPTPPTPESETSLVGGPVSRG